MEKIKTASEAREYLIEELKKQLVGPGMSNYEDYSKKEHLDKNEILNKSPRTIYTAGILFPQGDPNTSNDDDDEKHENEKILNEIETEEPHIKKTDEDSNVNEDVSDNNFDIDLTNELRASAMGISILASIDETIIIGVEDIGQYTKMAKEPNKELLETCCYLSKYENSYEWMTNQFNLDKNTQEECHRFLENTFSVPNIKVSIRDYFDPHFKDNKRVGFNKVSTPKHISTTIKSLENVSREDLQKKIIEYVTLSNDNALSQKEVKTGYQRNSVSSFIEIQPSELEKNKTRIKKNLKNENGEDFGLMISIMIRPYHLDKTKKYLTISLVNSNLASKEKISVNKCFFQSNFYIKSKQNSAKIFHQFEQINLEKLSDEEKSLHLIHNNRKSYAIGHGCAPTWGYDENKNFVIKSEIIPVYETKPIKAKEFDDLNLNMKTFSEDINFSISESKKLLEKYEHWIQNEEIKGSNFKESVFKEISKVNTDKCKAIIKRINEGINILENDHLAQNAFRFMNKSMYLQQVHYKIKNFSKNLNYDQELKKLKKGNWRPFQLAFILLNIKSLVNPEEEDRNIMDLIWFPTGGGKTEAYLGLTSFTIFLRKLNSKEEKGCAVLMRYTLRLLTTQQFERAASLICACENIRRENAKTLGNEQISLGLWIGKESTPNKEQEASQDLNELIINPKNNSKNKFILLNCPWCMESFSENQERPKGYKILGKKKLFHYVCPNKDCSFSSDKNSLPITVIDERIYKSPPTLLIGTIDKFASVTWLEEAISMFDNDEFTKPDLIIQDELHLISGPLGSIAGMYEILLSALTEKKINNKLIKAKIIGSTATISRAEKQVKNLYGKNCNIFPPQTNQLEDSFFSYEAKNEEGRKYVGVFCPSATSPQITQAKIMSAMCMAANEARIKSDNSTKCYDPYWTNLFYFNSIRELMGGSALIQADAKGNLRGEYYRKGLTKEIMGEKYNKDLRRGLYKPEELTSRVQSNAVPEILARLFNEHSIEENKSLDICLTTNMIQVGIDIPRLALMTIVGQPKTTSEYIQASSRVGRDQSKPGLVLTILSPFRPRDRSHYEKFHSYHENLYKFVEPTSITSHSDPVRKRCLHAIIIGLARLWGSTLRYSPSVPDEKLKNKIKEYILNYVKVADQDHPEEIVNTEKEIKYIFEKWENAKPQEYGKMVSIANQTSNSLLMIPAGSEVPPEGDPFETLTSMRNVDKECNAVIIKSYKGKLG